MKNSKKVIISLHQPGYHRYLGYYKKILASNIFVDCNTVQYVSKEWQNRQKFIHRGKEVWLSVPVQSGFEAIKDKVIVDNGWRKNHFLTLQEIYKHTPYWNDHIDFMQEFYSKKHIFLDQMCREMNNYVLDYLGIKTKIYTASDFEDKNTYQYKKGQLISKLISDLKTKRVELENSDIIYLSGTGAITYMDSEDSSGKKQIQYLLDNNIDVEYQEFTPKPYKQIHSPNVFIPYLSVFDAMLNVGKEATLELLMS